MVDWKGSLSADYLADQMDVEAVAAKAGSWDDGVAGCSAVWLVMGMADSSVDRMDGFAVAR